MSRSLRLRRATAFDRELLFAWVNDPGARASAFDARPIGWDEHTAWFDGRVDSPSSVIFVAEDNGGIAVGQVRFEIDGDGIAEVDISMASAFRGRGLGADVVKQACELMRGDRVRRVVAHVRPGNVQSLRAFAKAGFQSVGRERVHGRDSIRLEWPGTEGDR